MWLFPVGLLLHDAEEAAVMPSWLTSHGEAVLALAFRFGAGMRVETFLNATSVQYVLAVILVVAAAFLITWLTIRNGCRGVWFRVYLIVLGMAALHVFVHIAQAIALKTYVPGLFGAVLLLLPMCLVVYRALFRQKRASPVLAGTYAALGIILFVPMALLAHALVGMGAL